jgi:hypothetical protein
MKASIRDMKNKVNQELILKHISEADFASKSDLALRTGIRIQFLNKVLETFPVEVKIYDQIKSAISIYIEKENQILMDRIVQLNKQNLPMYLITKKLGIGISRCKELLEKVTNGN